LNRIASPNGPPPSTNWSRDVHRAAAAEGIRCVATVPDGGLKALIELCDEDPDLRVVTLTTEEEGIGLLAGMWLGGVKGVLLMQSSGVGNCINMLSLPHVCRIPCLVLVTMRGGPAEFNPWQVPMGQAVRPTLEAVGVSVHEPRRAEEVGASFQRAACAAFATGTTAAVLVSQAILGAKDFGRDRGAS